MNIPQNNSVNVHYNKPQQLARAIDAKDERDIWGRGTGKSEGRLSVRALDMAQQMPRCSFVNVANTYMQLLDRTLPPMIKHWQELGMQRDIDFWVRRPPNKDFGLKMPYIMPETMEHCIFIRANKKEVSVMRLVSQDRPASSSGLSVDGIIGDEARYLNNQKLQDELIPTNRGNERYFKGSHLHHSTCYTTDMPNTPESKWLIEEEKKMDTEAVELIKAIQVQVYKIEVSAQARGRYTQSEQASLKFYKNELFKLRKDLLYFSEASTLENIHVLGEDYIRRMRKQLTPAEFNRAILNIRPATVENAFYPDLAERHFYTAYNYGIIISLSDDQYGKGNFTDCRKDNDLNYKKPLCVAPDFGGSFNCLTVGQPEARYFNFLKNFYVKNPERVRDLVDNFDTYYRHFSKKEIIFYYDHTHYQDNPVDKDPKAILIDRFEAKGWDVTERYIGHTPSYTTRHELWSMGLSGDDDKVLLPRFNKYNTEQLRNSMQNTAIKPGAKSDPFEKDKSAEKKKDIDQLEAPHLGDSADVLYFGANLDHFKQYNIAPDAYALGRR